jgi:PAS domain S-box-containing protein
MEESAQLLLNALPVALLRHDLGGKIIFANRAFERETGLWARALPGKAVLGLEHFDGKDAQAWTDALRTAAAVATPVSIEVVYHHPGGSRHYQVEVVPESASEGGLAASLLSVLRDITKLRQSHADLQHARSQMESQHAELLKVNGHLETFVYTAAHDLRSPVANLLVLTKLLMGNPRPEQQPMLMESVQQAVTRLDHTITGLVEVLEVQSTFHVAVQSTRFEDALAQTRDELAAEMAGVDVTLSSDFTPCPRINYIRAYLSSIFRNLLGNALKYRVEGRPLEVSVTSGRTGEYVTLAFSDNGTGIDLARQGHKLFRPFSRLTTQGDGKGMGLHLVKNMVEKNGGRIGVESAAGRGTTFTVYLKEYPDTKNNL